nr:MAG TPA: hypothetical protein [Caudoviricetes sp.]
MLTFHTLINRFLRECLEIFVFLMGLNQNEVL